MLPRGEPLRERWRVIPDDTDVLITHGPPNVVGDQVSVGFKCQNVGCEDLRDRLQQLSVRAHVFGHIHEGYGEYQLGKARLVNASTCTARYTPTNPPIVLDLEVSGDKP